MVPVTFTRRGIPLLKEAVTSPSLASFVAEDGTLHIADEQQAHRIIRALGEAGYPQPAPGELNAMALLVRLYRKLIYHYATVVAPHASRQAEAYCTDVVGEYRLQQLRKLAREEFSATDAERLSEAVVIWLCNTNPALQHFRFLFDDTSLAKARYTDVITALNAFYRSAPPLYDDTSLLDALSAPARLHPDSLYRQLESFRQTTDDLIGDILWDVLLGMDILQEEQAQRGGGPGPVEVLDFAESIPSHEEYEAFSHDRSWMGNLVLLAKSTYVWLAQLSHTYGRTISELDEIPDQELQAIASRGFNGLWLIGVWERSTASAEIKHRMGNPDAMASAYSLKNYHTARALGGDSAMERLQKRAWRFGIRIGCDMVPNHMGIDSDWVAQHPDWFLQLDEPPYPGYSFHSENLSQHPQLDVRIEDHYYDRSDAAVVFRLVHQADGKERFVYHGNDGTSIPWNDTAQLNYLLPQVREGVIRQIIDIAKRYPIIRFDAAMTLAKKHIQRLWFPQPGSGGAIPSRAHHALSNAQFQAAIPEEFWREVVDRVAREAPDTLLLAEAFWMMEGYFVRTLGMHRVYNSAFMHMLKDEENTKYRQSIRNILAFNPQILQRFVNFMSNPDEETAIAQFGDGDKYFGVCVMMATLPGLPMFAHGQIEGFTERYGMEFARPSRWEIPNSGLVHWHEKIIFPLLAKRHLFAQVENFRLFDFVTPAGYTNEDVFAYSNEADGQRSLILYHNRFAETSGFVASGKHPYRDGDTVDWRQFSLAEVWHLHPEPGWFTIFTDLVSGLTYVRRSRDLQENGLFFHLKPYGHAVLWDVQELSDSDGTMAQIHDHLAGEGTVHIHQTLLRLQRKEIIDLVLHLLSPLMLRQVVYAARLDASRPLFSEELFTRFAPITKEIVDYLQGDEDPEILTKTMCRTITNIATAAPRHFLPQLIIAGILQPLDALFTRHYGVTWFEALFLHQELPSLLQEVLKQNTEIPLEHIIPAAINLLGWFEHSHPETMEKILQIPAIQTVLDVHEFDSVRWYSSDGMQVFHRLLLAVIPCLDILHRELCKEFAEKLEMADAIAEFHFDTLKTLLKGDANGC